MKTPQKPKNRTATAPQGTRDLMNRAISLMAVGLDAIAGEIDSIQDGNGPRSKATPAAQIANLTKKAAEIAGEARKIDAAESKRVAALTRPMVLRWLRGLEPDQRAAIRRELEAMDGEESVLS